jgi:DNA gyrase/topoisomerase IV subunit A
LGRKEEAEMGQDKIVIITKKGIIKKISSDKVRETGRLSQGVTGIALQGDDEVVAVTTVVEE